MGGWIDVGLCGIGGIADAGTGGWTTAATMLAGCITVEAEDFWGCKGFAFSPLVTRGGGGVLVSLSCLLRPRPRATRAAVEGFFSTLSWTVLDSLAVLLRKYDIEHFAEVVRINELEKLRNCSFHLQGQFPAIELTVLPRWDMEDHVIVESFLP